MIFGTFRFLLLFLSHVTLWDITTSDPLEKALLVFLSTGCQNITAVIYSVFQETKCFYHIAVLFGRTAFLKGVFRNTGTYLRVNVRWLIYSFTKCNNQKNSNSLQNIFKKYVPSSTDNTDNNADIHTNSAYPS